MSNKSIFKTFPEKEELLQWAAAYADEKPVQVNGHFHTPYSFSAFQEIEQAFEMAKEEEVPVLGINDFFTTEGYEEFTELAKQYRIFPLYNIEFMALQKDLQEKGVKVNDPNNPGRTYFSGKGLAFPSTLQGKYLEMLKQVQDESNLQTEEMVEKLNGLLSEIGSNLQFDFSELKQKYAKNLFRERHIAKALREAIFEKYETGQIRKDFFTELFSGKELKSNINDFVGIENEIRGNLLKAGGKAFVPENDKAFLSLEDVKALIINAGGIPCYPVLLDNPKGEYTDFEGNKDALLAELTAKNVASLELIPARNNYNVFKEFVKFFHKKGFVITFGTEHNTPKLDPIKVSGGGGTELDAEVLQIGYEGTCVIAAHQYLVAKGEPGYLNEDGTARISEKTDFVKLGNAVIKKFIA